MSVAEHKRVTAYPTASRMFCKMRGHGGECAGQVNIITINEGDNIPGHLLQSFVDGVHLAAVFFAHPVGKPPFVTTKDGHSLVCASAIENDVFEVRIALIQDRENRFFYESALVIRGGDDTDFRQHQGSS